MDSNNEITHRAYYGEKNFNEVLTIDLSRGRKISGVRTEIWQPDYPIDVIYECDSIPCETRKRLFSHTKKPKK